MTLGIMNWAVIIYFENIFVSVHAENRRPSRGQAAAPDTADSRGQDEVSKPNFNVFIIII